MALIGGVLTPVSWLNYNLALIPPWLPNHPQLPTGSFIPCNYSPGHCSTKAAALAEQGKKVLQGLRVSDVTD